MSLVEYLYVDENRLNSYFEQISSPTTYDKVPVWKAGISLTGPNAEGQQARFPRPFTTHEKISKLKDYIAGNEEARHIFRDIHDSAIKVVIPQEICGTTFKGLTLWVISPCEDDENQTLWLVEDYRKSDDAKFPSWWRNMTGLSALEILFSDISGTRSVNEWRFSEHKQALLRCGVGQAEVENEIRTNTLSFFSRIGAKISSPRLIHSCYRVRTTYRNIKLRSNIIIGYPIWIIAA